MSRDLRTLRGICGHLAVPQPFDLGQFAGAVSEQRRRPVQLLDLPPAARGQLSGAWIATGDTDVIFLDPDASPFHRDIIGLHEFGHLLCAHPADPAWDEALLTVLLPGLSMAAVRHMRGRHGYPCGSGDEEREAELIASLILARANTGPAADLASSSALMPRLSEALRHPVRHV